MPIYEYRAKDRGRACEHCRNGFEVLQNMSDPPLAACPKCGAAVQKLISAPSVGKMASRDG